ncbi:MAG: DNA polymerase III subunit beta [Verrucomicrobiales bacterium]
MKFTITKDKFNNGLSQVLNVVNSRVTLPILSNVLIEAREDELVLTTTDLDVGITGRVAATVAEGGAVTLPARKLATIIRELPDAEITVSVDADNVASVRCGASFFKILGLGPEEFPPLTEPDNAAEFKLAQATLKDGLRKTAYAISTDETRYVLNGIFHSFRDAKLTLVATDGRRLATAEFDVEFPDSQEVDFILPTKAVNEIQRLLGDEGDVRIKVGASQVVFQLNENVLYSKLVDGTYPNFRQVIPGPANHRVTFEREHLLKSIQRVSLLSSDKASTVKLHFLDGEVKLSASSADVGEAEESLPVKYSGREMAIAFNPEYFMAPLRNLANDEVHLDLIDELSPGVIKTNEPFLYVIMPMRTSA